MTFLPIVERELRVRSRRGATYWLRALLALLAVFVCTQLLSHAAIGIAPAAAGQAAFRTLAWMALFLAFASTLLTADCISSERREGTLGLLRLTSLSGCDIVLGKLAVSGLAAVYAMLGLAPALTVPIVIGGLTGGEVARTALALLNALFAALSVGMWVSAPARQQLPAVRNAGLVLLAMAIGPWTAGPFRVFSPLGAFWWADAASYASAPWEFWLSLLSVQLECWLLLWAASRAVLRDAADAGVAAGPPAKPFRSLRALFRDHLDASVPAEPYPSPTSGEMAGVKGRTFPSSEGGGQSVDSPPPRLDPLPVWERGDSAAETAQRTADPMRWLMGRLRGQRAIIWMAGILFCLVSVSTPLLWRLGPVPFGAAVMQAYQTTGALLYFVWNALFAWAAGRFFLETKRSGELELLLSTPLGAKEVVRGQWRAMWRLLRGPLVLAALVYAFQFLMFLGQPRFANDSWYRVIWALGGVTNAARLVLDVLAVCWTGMWFGLTARKPAAAIAWTVGLVSGLPLLAVWLVRLGLALAVPYGSGQYLWFVFNFLAMPLLMVLKNVAFIFWARAKLRTNLGNATASPLAARETLAEAARWLAQALQQARRWPPGPSQSRV